MSSDTELTEHRHDPYAAIRIAEFRYFLSARLFMTLALMIIDVIVYWSVFEKTKDPLSIGLIGLAEAVPAILVALYAGHIADRRSRKKIVNQFQSLLLICTLGLMLLNMNHSAVAQSLELGSIYFLVFIIGIARGFLGPALFGIQGQIVPRELYANASTWNSTVWHTGSVAGPAVGGLVYGAFGITYAYAIACSFLFISFILLFLIKARPIPTATVKESLKESLMTGVRFVFQNQVILGALSLDLFAVFFGGAVALLPFFASKEILNVGPEGLGLLRAAPAMGAVLMAIVLAYWPQNRNAGRNLLVCVAGFGLCMALFAISRNFILSMALLILSGMFDNVSVVIRGTILQVMTPDHMRGRVSSVNSIFIGSSNEIGALESGVAAKLMGIIPSVIFGGIMTMLVVAFTTKKAPELRNLNISELQEKEAEA